MENKYSNRSFAEDDGLSINDGYLLKAAAANIFSNEYNEYQAAQKKYSDVTILPEYQNGRIAVLRALSTNMRKEHHRHLIKQARRIVAIIAIGCVSIFSLVYTTVDAVRASVNNFFLELGDGYAIIHQIGESGSPILPEKWSNIIVPSWIPARYKYVLGTDSKDMKELVYQSDKPDDVLLISAWTNGMVPYIDQERLSLVKEISLNDIPSYLYKDSSTNRFALLFVKNDYTVHISGTVTEAEIIEIGENLIINNN